MSTTEKESGLRRAESAFGVGVPMAGSAISMTWTAISIGDLLGGNPFTYAVVTTIEMAWAYAIYQDWRYPATWKERKHTQIISWFFLALAVTLIAVHGAETNVWVAVGGAAVPVASKVLWIMAMSVGPHQQRRRREQELAAIREEADFERAKAELKAEQELADLRSSSRQTRDELVQLAETTMLKNDLQTKLAIQSGTTYEVSRTDVPVSGTSVPNVSPEPPDPLDQLSRGRPELVAAAKGSAGPAHLVGVLKESGLTRDQVAQMVSELRPDFKPESVRKAVRRAYPEKIPGTGNYM